MYYFTTSNLSDVASFFTLMEDSVGETSLLEDTQPMLNFRHILKQFRLKDFRDMYVCTMIVWISVMCTEVNPVAIVRQTVYGYQQCAFLSLQNKWRPESY